MTNKWRNAGAPFTLSDGTEVARGEVFEAPVTSRDVQMRRRKLEPVSPDSEVTAASPEERLGGVNFGSGAAFELAKSEGLRSLDFRWREGSGQGGAFLKRDVEEIVDG